MEVGWVRKDPDKRVASRQASVTTPSPQDRLCEIATLRAALEEAVGEIAAGAVDSGFSCTTIGTQTGITETMRLAREDEVRGRPGRRKERGVPTFDGVTITIREELDARWRREDDAGPRVVKVTDPVALAEMQAWLLRHVRDPLPGSMQFLSLLIEEPGNCP